MKKTFLALGIALFTFCTTAHAQFANLVNPGPLSSPHQYLEGIKNCTQCHASASGVPDEKCLACHKEIQERISQRKGYHSRVLGDCVKCHGEHKGADYDVTGLSRLTFDHTDTGWPLTGGHQNLDCPKCHTKMRKNIVTGAATSYKTYLGNNSNCKSCHTDVHKSKNASFQQCYKCHDTSSWQQRAQSNFNHNKETEFKQIVGKHAETQCYKCHTTKTWAPLTKNCVNCHKDPHKGQFGKTCETCHNPRAWKNTSVGGAASAGASKPSVPETPAVPVPSVKGGKNKKAAEAATAAPVFDHSKTAFPLLGKHQTVACKSCHGSKIGKVKRNFKDCVGCHVDPHKGAFKPAPCYSCHSNDGFNVMKSKPTAPSSAPTSVQSDDSPAVTSAVEAAPTPSVNVPRTTAAQAGFDHTRTGFPLVGKHQFVTCDNCHAGGKFKGLGRECSSCHNDFHKGELGMECERCHSPVTSFQDIEFNHNREAKFRIDGQHVKNQCNQCHWNNKYKMGDFTCSTCHVDVHKGSFGPNCDNCHTTSNFKMTKGFHEFGGFRITGVHNKLNCNTCHNPKAPARARPMECSSCHRDPHMNSLGMNCYTCHGQNAWMPTTFRHNQTGFELSGAHRFLQCSNCHFNRVFGGLNSECMSCHMKDFNASLPQHVGAPTTCNTCHYTFGFRPAKR